MEAIDSHKDPDEPLDYSVYMPSLYAALQVIPPLFSGYYDIIY